MNKMIKLPLFLGVVGAACAVILSGLYQVTSPIVKKNQDLKIAANYLAMFEDLGVKQEEIAVVGLIELSDELFDIGCTGKAIVDNGTVKGIAYTCSFAGFAGDVSFQIAFANGKYKAFTDLGNVETAQGETAMKELPSLVNPDLNMSGSLASNLSVVSASSYTGVPISNIVEVCKADYLAWYNA